MKAYSQDLRERVVRACDEQRGTRQQIADLFGVSTSVLRQSKLELAFAGVSGNTLAEEPP
jgi:transposase-like protein